MSEAQQTTTEERWGVVQVAAHLQLSYQTARNNMLAGDYGVSEYNAETRKLTVPANAVRAMKAALKKNDAKTMPRGEYRKKSGKYVVTKPKKKRSK